MLTRLESYCISCLLALTLPLMAADRGGDTRHGLGLSVGVGGALQLQQSANYTLKSRLGVDTQAELFYSLRHRRFIWEIGGTFDWDRTQQRVGAFMNEIECYDNDVIPEPLLFRYHFTNMQETQQFCWVGGQTRFGVHFTDQWYGMVGLKVEVPVLGDYHTTADLMTDGFYPTDLEPHGNDASYAFFPEVKMAYGESYTLRPLLLTPSLELGGEFILAPAVSLRAALFGEYGIPVMLETSSFSLSSYSIEAVTDPCNLSLEQMQSAVRFQSLLSFDDGKGIWQRARFGVKLTLLIRPSAPERCNCWDELPLKHHKRNSSRLGYHRVRAHRYNDY